MVWLGIDTATSYCRTGLWHSADNRLIATQETDIGMGHAEILMTQIDTLLAKANIKRPELSRIICTIGPGSFTGVRVGLAAAKALSQALSIPLVGVTTLESLALDAAALTTKPFTVVLDARRSQLYVQDFDADGTALSEPRIVALGDIEPNSLLFVGSGGALLSSDTILPYASGGSVRAMMLVGQTRTVSREPLTPLYLRDADAKQPKTRFAVERQGETLS